MFGYSFAIPSSIVTKVVTDIKQYGTVQRAVLGVLFSELTPQLAKEKGITIVNDGILVGEVLDRSAAMDGGIKAGDVIVDINGVAIYIIRRNCKVKSVNIAPEIKSVSGMCVIIHHIPLMWSFRIARVILM